MALSKLNNDSFADTAVHGRRNLIINGAMQVAQRSTSVTSITGSDYHTMDRWKIDLNSLGTWSFSQSSTAPDGFANSYKLDCTTADASPAAGDYLILQQRFEGQNMQMLKKGTSAAESVTVSFSIRSSVTGTYTCELYDNDNGRYIGKTFTVDAADTWERKTITFPGDTTGALNDDNALSFFCQILFAAGSNFNGGTFNNGTWGAGGNNTRVSSSNVNLASSTSNEAYVTGWQMEVGEQATPFEHRSYADELRRCQRYYEMTGAGAPAKANSSTEFWVGLKFQVAKRTNPTASMVDPNTAIRIFEFGVGDRDSDSTPSISSAYYNLHGANVRVGTFSGISGGDTAITGGTPGDNSANQFAFDAEL